MIKHVTIPKFEQLTGYTVKAVRRKIADGVWMEGLIWIKAPDGRILINLEGYEEWVMMALENPRKAPLRSTSATRATDAGKNSSSSPPPLI